MLTRSGLDLDFAIHGAAFEVINPTHGVRALHLHRVSHQHDVHGALAAYFDCEEAVDAGE